MHVATVGGIKALDLRNYLIAETNFSSALEVARKIFKHTDHRIPETFGSLGQALLQKKKVSPNGTRVEAVGKDRQVVEKDECANCHC